MNQLIIGLHRGTGLVSKAIQWQTRSPYSHVSVMCRNGCGIEAREGKGVRVTTDWLKFKAPGERVDLFVVEVTPAQADSIEAFLLDQVGKKYDWTMVFRFVSRQQASRDESGKWFCSELAFAAFQQAGVDLLRDTQPWEVSPGLLGKSPLLRLVYEENPPAPPSGSPV